MSGIFENAETLVVKLGTHIVTENGKEFARDRVAGIVRECAELHRQGKRVVMVVSGAVALGRKKLAIKKQLSLVDKQVCAAVGQAMLMEEFRALFDPHKIPVAQVLLTSADFAKRVSYLKLRSVFARLLDMRIIPIVNENDTVSTIEFDDPDRGRSFGDNDKLSALVAGKLGADLLVMLTNVDGIYDRNPEEHKDAALISRIEKFDDLAGVKATGQSAYGRGGMLTKLEAARVAAISGVDVVIASGMKSNTLSRLFSEEGPPGTIVLAKRSVRSRKQWLGLASGYEGVLVVNDGARAALLERQASLLPAGVTAVQGKFARGQVVSIQDPEQNELGRGLSQFSSSEINRIKGLHTKQLREKLGLSADEKCPAEIIHRDDLVVFDEIEE